MHTETHAHKNKKKAKSEAVSTDCTDWEQIRDKNICPDSTCSDVWRKFANFLWKKFPETINKQDVKKGKLLMTQKLWLPIELLRVKGK